MPGESGAAMLGAMDIGPYEVVGELARGGMGVVYRARDQLGRELAIKVLLRGGWSSPNQRQRFQREVELLARLRHRHIVAVHAAGEHQGAPYVVMDLVEGVSLQDRLEREGPLPLAEALRIGRGLAAALEHAHAQGILHRDLKPANVLLARGEPLLTDFGLAQDLHHGPSPHSRLSREGVFLGTPGYWPPEQAAGQLAELGARSDVYGLGATLFALLTGRPPFVHAGLADLLRCTKEVAPRASSLRPEVPRPVDAVLERCLRIEPGQRFASARELGEALDELLAGRGGAAPARWRALLAGAALFAAGVLLALGWAGAPPQAATAAPPPPPPPLDQGQETPAALLQRSEALLAVGDIPHALAAAGRALELEPSALGFEARGLVREQGGDLDGAVEDFTRALELYPRLTRSLMRRGVIRAIQRRYREAEEDLSCLLELEPDLGEAWEERGFVRHELDSFPGAMRDLDRAIELRPGSARAWSVRGWLKARLDDFPGAVADLDRAIALDPQPLWLARRGRLRVRTGDLPGAVEDLERAQPLLPHDADIPADLGRARLQRGELPAALEAVDCSLELDPRSARTWELRAQVRAAQSDVQGALEDIEAALSRVPDSPGFLRARADYRLKLGDIRGAVADCLRSREQNLDDTRTWLERSSRQAWRAAAGALPPGSPERERLEELLAGLGE